MYCLEIDVGCDASPPFVDHNHLVPNEPREGGFHVGLEQIPHLWPIKFVFSWEVTLPLVHHMRTPWDLADDKVPTRFCDVVKKAKSLHPMPMIQVPSKSAHFTIDEADAKKF